MLQRIPEYENSRLMVKTTPEDDLNRALMNAVPHLSITKDNWIRDDYKSYYGLFHTMISADRGGFKNVHLLEFQSTAGTVMATNWSMNKNWIGSYAHPLKYELRAADPRRRDHQYAEVDPYTICSAMQDCMQMRSREELSGRNAAETIPVMMSWTGCIDTLFLRISSVLPREGSILRDIYLRLNPIEEERSAWNM
jgi:hypothetical protein